MPEKRQYLFEKKRFGVRNLFPFSFSLLPLKPLQPMHNRFLIRIDLDPDRIAGFEAALFEFFYHMVMLLH